MGWGEMMGSNDISTPEKRDHHTSDCLSEQNARLPWQVWFSIGVLILSAGLTFSSLVQNNMFGAIMALISTFALIYGLYQKHRWAFIVYLLFSLLNVFLFSNKPGLPIANLVLGGILLTAYPHFFRKTKEVSALSYANMLKKHVIMGFGGLLIFLMFMIATENAVIKSLTDGFSEYRAVSCCANVAEQIKSDLLAMQNIASDSLPGMPPSKDSKEGFDRIIDKYKSRFAYQLKATKESNTFFGHGSKFDLRHEVDSLIKVSDTCYTEVRDFIGGGYTEAVYGEQINTNATAIVDFLVSAMIAANSEGDRNTALNVAIALQHFQSNRLAVCRFIVAQSHNSVDGKILNMVLNKSAEALTALDKHIKEPGIRQEFVIAQNAFEEYRGALSSETKTLAERDDKAANIFRNIGPETRAQLDITQEGFNKDQEIRYKEVTTSHRSLISLMMLLVAGAIFSGIFSYNLLPLKTRAYTEKKLNAPNAEFLNRMVDRRVKTGYSIILLLLATIAFIDFIETRNDLKILSEYHTLANNISGAGMLQTNMQHMHLLTSPYLAGSTNWAIDKSIEIYNNTTMYEIKNSYPYGVKMGKEGSVFKQLLLKWVEYQKGADKLINNTVVAKLMTDSIHEDGFVLVDALSNIMMTAMAEGNTSVALKSGIALQDLLSTHLAAIQYINATEHKPGEVDTLKVNMEKLTAILASLDNAEEKTENQKVLNNAKKTLKCYQGCMDYLYPILAENDDLRTTIFQQREPEMIKEVSLVREEIEKKQDMLKKELDDSSKRAFILIRILGVITALTGVGFLWNIFHWISKKNHAFDA